MPVPRLAFADNSSFENMQGGKQGGGSVPLVIVRLPRGQAGPERKDRLRPVERLNLAFLIHAQHDGFIRRVHTQAHDVANLRSKLRIVAELERLHPFGAAACASSRSAAPLPNSPSGLLPWHVRSNAWHFSGSFSSLLPRWPPPARQRSVWGGHCAAVLREALQPITFIPLPPQQHGGY